MDFAFYIYLSKLFDESLIYIFLLLEIKQIELI